MDDLKRYIREPINGLSHTVGAFLAFIGLIVLLYKSVEEGSFSKTVAFSIFGTSMVCMYLSSSLFHSIPAKRKTLHRFRTLDHCMIYVFIAGSYTPVCLLLLRGHLRWIAFSCVWTIAALGILQKIFWMRAPRWFSTMLYLLAGWLGLSLYPFLLRSAPAYFLLWMLIGGLAYTLGAAIYGLEKPNPIPGWFGHHEIWHLFVMAGTLAHFWAFYRYLS